MFPLFDQSVGLLMIAVYAIFAFGLTSWFAKNYDRTKESFLVADRTVPYWQGSMAVGASWIWAPGLFVAAQQGFNNGLAGVFWFSLGNFFSLIIFSYAAKKIRDQYSEGFTLSQWFRGKYGKFIQFLVLINTALYALQGITINLFAGSKSVTLLSGLPQLLVSVLLVAIALTYSWRGGLKASIATDIAKIVAIWIGMIIVGVCVFGHTGFDPVIAGAAGKSGAGTTLFSSPLALGLFFGFGVPTVVGHLAMSWSDNSNYQNAFSMTPDVVRKAFITAPLYWLILPTLGGMIGMLAAGLNYDVKGPDTGFINIVVMAKEVGSWLPFVYMAVVFAGLVSIIDTQMLSAGNIGGNDVHDSANGSNAIQWGRWAMVVLAVFGVALANIPGLDINTIFVFSKSLTLVFFAPIAMAIVAGNHLTKQGFIAGSIVGMFVGLPVFTYGQFWGGGSQIIALGVVIQVFGSAAVTWIVSKLTA